MNIEKVKKYIDLIEAKDYFEIAKILTRLNAEELLPEKEKHWRRKMTNKEREELIDELINDTIPENFVKLLDETIGLEVFVDDIEEFLQYRSVAKNKKRKELICKFVYNTTPENLLELLDDIVGIEHLIDKVEKVLQDEKVWTDEKLIKLKKKLL